MADSSPSIIIKREWTPKKLVKDLELKGRPTVRRAVNWVDDLMELKRVVTLCSGCLHKYREGLKRYGYQQEKEFPHVLSNCVDCNVLDPRCSAWFHETIYKLVRSTADERRALNKSRAARLKKGYL